MHNPYDLHSWSKLYREEALQETQTRHLKGRLRASRRAQPERSRTGLAWNAVLASLRGAKFTGALEPGEEER
jgi:hypothetical protein